MNRKERVYAVLGGEKADRVPVGFWMHFPQHALYGQAAVDEHMRFFEQSQNDLCKVMNEHIYPSQHNIKAASDWSLVEEYGIDADFIQKQAWIIKEVAKTCTDAPIAATIHGVVASASHTLLGEQRYDSVGRFAQLYHLRTNPQAITGAYQRIANTLCAMTKACLEAGAEGIYYAALGGESDGFTDEEHRKFIAPLDCQVIRCAYDNGAKFVALHMCKPKVSLQRFVDYPCDIVNWGVEESGVTLGEAKKIFPGKVLLGGFPSHHGSVVDGNDERIQAEISALVAQTGEKRLILGSDCTLPGNIPYENIAKVAKASQLFAQGAMENARSNG